MKKEITFMYKNQWQKVCAVESSKKRKDNWCSIFKSFDDISGVPL